MAPPDTGSRSSRTSNVATATRADRRGSRSRSRGTRSRRAPNRTPPPASYAARRSAAIAGVLAVALLLLAVLERVEYGGRVVPGVEVGDLDLSGKSERDAYAQIGRLSSALETEPIVARAGDAKLEANPANLGLDIDEVATLRAARRAGRSGNPLEQTLGTVLRRLRPDEVPLVVHYDPDALEGLLDGWEHEVGDGLVEGGLRFEGTTVVEVEPRAGTGLRREAARALLERRLRSADRSPIELPVGRVEPEVSRATVAATAARARKLLDGRYTIRAGANSVPFAPDQLAKALGTRVDGSRLVLTVDGDRLRAAIGPALTSLERAPVEAGFEVVSADRVDVVPSQDGVQVDMDAVGRAILRGERTIVAKLEPVRPRRDTRWARSLGITEQVSSFTTYHAPGQARVTNIHRAADLLNNTVVEPGEVFSMNEVVGPRTPERGFVPAPVFYGEFTEDFGGGVSQLATTLFNAIFFGGYEDVEHKPHTIYISRYPMGRESTINYGTVDVKFRNDSRHGVLIRTGYSDSAITVTFFGDKEGKVVREEGRKILGETPVTDQLIACPAPEVDLENACADLAALQTEVVEEGHTGYDVEFYRVIEQPGRETVRERFRWRYRMTPNKVLVGTGPPPSTTTTAKPKTSSTTTRPSGSTTVPKPPKSSTTAPKP